MIKIGMVCPGKTILNTWLRTNSTQNNSSANKGNPKKGGEHWPREQA